MTLQRASGIIVFAAMVMSINAGPVSAHHSVAGYDNTKEVQMRAVVVEYIWRNPHVVVVWDAKDEKGQAVRWSGEMNSTTSMISVGMNRNSLKPGDEIVISINPSKTTNPLGIIRKITMADGKLVVDRFTPQ